MAVYFAQVGRYIKVGYSENPERRVRRLWKSETRYSRPADCPTSPPLLLATIPGGRNEEFICHRALGDYAVGCEFFLDEPGVRMFIAAAAEGALDRVVRPSGPALGIASDTDGMTPSGVAAYRELIDRTMTRPVGRAS